VKKYGKAAVKKIKRNNVKRKVLDGLSGAFLSEFVEELQNITGMI
jgi:hypothetical protein